MITLKQIVLGPLQSNCYIVKHEDQALIVDPGFSPETIEKEINHQKVKPLAILLTHTHYDHIGAVDQLVAKYDLPVYVAPEELDWLSAPEKNLSALTKDAVIVKSEATPFEYGKTYEIGPFTFRVAHTPGHSPGGVSFIFENERFAITGDALFAMSVGRTDLPGSNPEVQIPALAKELLTLPDDFIIYPGHREASTIGKEKEFNPFFQ